MDLSTSAAKGDADGFGRPGDCFIVDSGWNTEDVEQLFGRCRHRSLPPRFV
jgi:hypothetical protein